ncbi:CBS domain-containing protein [Falsibacillus pallidus]|uniref:CBS domain protein n=1 Tax=Falsibacillus pallidus TaxID=493781 RepID=A0A370GP66_9BACI|nr:CBS domain-containing protein [Falsibacillus pallidus]RDI45467.1 CBS domain protein [Falsibacillus pallidus]
MLAQEIMNTHVYKVNEDATIRKVIEAFLEYRISGLPVVNNNNEIVGYISDGDIMQYIGKHEDIIIDSIFHVDVVKGDDEGFEERLKSILELNVMEMAKKHVVKTSWDEEVEEVAAILGKKQIKKLPVEKNGVLVGIISRGDVIRHTFKKIL